MQKVKDTIQQVYAMATELSNTKQSKQQFSFQEKVDKILEMSSLSDESFVDMNPHCYSASVNLNILTHCKAMKADDSAGFLEAMGEETK